MAKQKETTENTYSEDKQIESEAVESTYSKEELISNAHAFGVMPEVVAGALYTVKKDKLTRKEAEEAIKDFLERKCV